MSDTNKRKSNNEVNRKPKALVKLGANSNSNERYDSYGHMIENKKKDIPRTTEQKKAPGRDVKRAGQSVYTQNEDRKKVRSSKLSNGSIPRTEEKEQTRKNSKSVYAGQGPREKQGSYLPKDTKPLEEGNKRSEKNYSETNIGNKENNKITKDRVNSKYKKEEQQVKNEQAVDNKEEKRLRPHERRLKEKKPERIKFIKRILKVAMLILLVVGTIFMFWYAGSSNDDIRKAFLSTGSIERTIDSNVCVIKSETALVADFSGKVVARVNEGDRVKAGTVVAYIVKPEYESELVALRKIEDKITAAQKASAYVENEHVEVSSLNSQIYEETKALAMLSSVNYNFTDYTELKHDIDNLFETKHEILMNSETTDSYIKELKNQRNDILNSLGNYMSEIVTTEAGIVSFYTDSNCNEASEKIAQISNYIGNKGQTGNMLSESSIVFAGNSMSNMQNAEVTDGQVVARVTPDVKYYISATVPAKDVTSFYQGKDVKIRTKNRSFYVEGKVVDILNYGDKSYILVESSSGNAGVISSRIMEAEIVAESAEGLKVPKRALTEWDSARLTARISILRSNYVSYVFVNVLAEDGEYAIIAPSNGFVDEENNEEITSVRVNDMYVVNYELVTEGQIIGG